MSSAQKSGQPVFTLPALGGGSISIWDYRQRQPLVIVFCDQEDELEGWERMYPRYRRIDAEVLAVLRREPERITPSFPVLLDAEGKTFRRYAPRHPAILILDRYGELRSHKEGPWPNGPDHDDLLAELLFTQSECPECGVSEWP